ncbi:unnamed protein product, partial [Phaeothamnion confervicola]
MTKDERRGKFTQKAAEKRERERAKLRSKNSICLKCRRRGHVVADCRADGEEGAAAGSAGICFNCGSKEHTLQACPERPAPDGALPFATCFVCGETGHLSSSCGKNEKGVYPQGGSCRKCGSNTHLMSKCPKATIAGPRTAAGVDSGGRGAGAGSSDRSGEGATSGEDTDGDSGGDGDGGGGSGGGGGGGGGGSTTAAAAAARAAPARPVAVSHDGNTAPAARVGGDDLGDE